MTDQKEQRDQAIARFRRSRWPGLIWAVPIVAAVVVGWLGLSAYFQRGPQVTVTFPISGGLGEGTDVNYHGLTVGHVMDVRVGKSLAQMQVDIRFESTMKGHLGAGTLFWIAGKQVSITDLSSLKSVIAGPDIEVLPHDGPTVGDVLGLASSPVVDPELAGIHLVITAVHKGNLQPGAGIYFGGFQIGTVTDVAMVPHGSSFVIDAFIEEPYIHLLSNNSRFWDASGVQFLTSDGVPRVSFLSVGALVSGAVGVSTPAGGQALSSKDTFALYDNEAAAENAPGPYALSYHTVLSGGPDGLVVGSPVTLEGELVGDVTSVSMAFDQFSGSLQTMVALKIDPARIPLASGQEWDLANPEPQMNALLSHLITGGLRAQLVQSVPVIGQEELALAVVPNAKEAQFDGSFIPSTNNGSGGQLMAQVSAVLSNLQVASAAFSALSTSAQTRDTLKHLAQTVGNIQSITWATRQQMPQLLSAMRKATAQADQALQAAHDLMAVNGPVAADPQAQTLPHAMYELTRAATALRELTDELQAHPNALIFGRQ